ncbi:MAG: ammonia-forming cytochrome c nitrite reductase subunit c552 [Coriobacteriales bacterium]|jgi:nitrite reductase (cytochrome c-552)|nr:ammonia-forming cytochrome c nitrite reductase subunit c552 [Coriobacteriales bacterium]
MEEARKKTALRRWAVVGCVFALIFALAACSPKADDNSTAGSDSGSETAAELVAPELREANTGPNAAGVQTAESWKDAYPKEYETYMANLANDTSSRGNMIEMYPQITTIWAGNGFSKSYFEPNGHNYSLDDIRASGRVNDKTLANCLTCKSADFTAMYKAQGDAIFSQTFADVNATLEEPISCYNCHENDPTQLVTTQAFFLTGLGSDASKVPVESQVCGQCHNEYYFNADTKAVTNPYTSLAGMTPEAIYAYYTDKGFKDATNEATGVEWIKVQHPEFEFVYGGTGNTMINTNNPATGEPFTCASCHMGLQEDAGDGTYYTSHELISPLDNPELLAESCNIGGACHSDLAAQVEAWQQESEDKVQADADKLVELNTKLAEKKDSLDAETLAKVQALYREAQFYWEFVMVENSEGAHNPTLSNACLDLSAAKADEALALLG